MVTLNDPVDARFPDSTELNVKISYENVVVNVPTRACDANHPVNLSYRDYVDTKISKNYCFLPQQ